MTEKEKRIELLILKYGRYEPLTGEEEAILNEWRGRSDEHNALPERFRDEDWVQENLIRLNRIPSGEIWQRIAGQVKKEKRLKEKRLITTRFIKIVGTAAAIALIVVAIRVFIPGRSAVREETKGVAQTKPFDRTVRNPAGQRGPLSVVLPDGSEVKLNVASQITYNTAFEGAQRIVRLEGEASFKIKKDPAGRPFLVRTRFGETWDKSTEFDVRAYPDEAAGQVTLVEGGVTVKNGKDTFDLDKPLQQVQFTKARISDPIMLKSVDDAIAWRYGMFHFASTDMREAMRELARWYDKKVDFTDEVRGVGVGIDLPRSTSWKDALDAVMGQEGRYASYREQGDSVYVSAVRKGK